MSLELRNVTKRVGAEMHIHETNLVLEQGTFNILLGTTLAGKTTLMQLMAGLERPTIGRGLVPRQERHRRSGAEAQRLDGLPAVHQLPEFHGLREHRLAAARRRHGRAGDRGAGAEGRRAAAPDADAQAPAERAVRRPAAAHRHRPRPGQGLRPHPARRAARQSRLQAARGTARRAAEALRRPRLHRRLCDDRADRGAALRRQHRDPA